MNAATIIVAAAAVGTVLSYLTWLGWKEARENDRRRAALAGFELVGVRDQRVRNELLNEAALIVEHEAVKCYADAMGECAANAYRDAAKRLRAMRSTS